MFFGAVGKRRNPDFSEKMIETTIRKRAARTIAR
jgi:hypothetical protein